MVTSQPCRCTRSAPGSGAAAADDAGVADEEVAAGIDE